MTASPSTGSLLAAAVTLGTALLAVSCGPSLMKLPAGPVSHAPDAAEVLARATSACRGVRTLTAEVSVRGSTGSHRVSGRLLAGLAAPASARLEAVAPFGPPLFIFVANGEDATLLLPRDSRVLEHARPDLVLEALTGVPLGASDLRATLTGCTVGTPEAAQGRQLGAAWRLVPTVQGGEVYLHRDSDAASWQLVAVVGRTEGTRRGWRAEYRDFQNDMPRSVRVTSLAEDGGAGAFDLQLVLSQVEINVPLDADVFRVQPPKAADPITLEELRQVGPLARSRSRTRTKRGDGFPARCDRVAGAPGVNEDELGQSGLLASARPHAR